MSQCENLDGQCGASWCNCDEVRKKRSERMILIIHSGDLDMFAAVLKFVDERCKERGEAAFVRNTDKGHEIYSVKAP